MQYSASSRQGLDKKSINLTHTIKTYYPQPFLKIVILNLFRVFKNLTKALPIKYMAYVHTFFSYNF